jgi:hypothetical protein
MLCACLSFDDFNLCKILKNRLQFVEVLKNVYRSGPRVRVRVLPGAAQLARRG